MVSVTPTGGRRVRAVPPVPVPTESRAPLARMLLAGLAQVWAGRVGVTGLLGGRRAGVAGRDVAVPATSAPQLVAQVSTLPSSTHASSVSHLGVLAGPAPGRVRGSGDSSPAPKPAAAQSSSRALDRAASRAPRPLPRPSRPRRRPPHRRRRAPPGNRASRTRPPLSPPPPRNPASRRRPHSSPGHPRSRVSRRRPRRWPRRRRRQAHRIHPAELVRVGRLRVPDPTAGRAHPDRAGQCERRGRGSAGHGGGTDGRLDASDR